MIIYLEISRKKRSPKLCLRWAPYKALGPDGFRVVFYKKCWDIMRQRVIDTCLGILNGRQSIALLNSTHIVLISKKKNPKKVADFRPISLCNVVHKLVTKTLANRMQRVLSQFISPFQSDFVPGRQIFDNVIIAYESLHSLCGKNNETTSFMALKFNCSKAYDRVEQDFLKAIMRKIGFNQIWIQLVMDCIATPNFAFIINDTLFGMVISSRGLHQ